MFAHFVFYLFKDESSRWWFSRCSASWHSELTAGFQVELMVFKYMKHVTIILKLLLTINFKFYLWHSNRALRKPINYFMMILCLNSTSFHCWLILAVSLHPALFLLNHRVIIKILLHFLNWLLLWLPLDNSLRTLSKPNPPKLSNKYYVKKWFRRHQ